jgi:hypothetical protein
MILRTLLILSTGITLSIFGDELKDSIDQQNQKITSSSDAEKGSLMVQLACLYLKDQDLERAFKVFLDALLSVIVKENVQGENVTDLNKSAFDLYLFKDNTPIEAAKEVCSKYEPMLETYSNDIPLKYMVAIAHANLNHYDKFFKLFYEAYLLDPHYYLAYKTKAVIYIKLFERARVPQEKALLREEIIKNLKIAIEKKPQDYTLFKLLFTFSSPENKKTEITESLNKILSESILIPRTEIQFFIEKLEKIDRIDLALQLLEKAQGWYPNSRILRASQNYLNERLQ